MKRFNLSNTLGFALKNFATPIVFFVMFYEVGAKAAIGFAVAAALLQFLAHLIFRWRFTMFFILATAFTVLFGGADLFIEAPKYFRLEPFAQNFCIGIIFLFTLRTQRSMIYRLAMSVPHEYRPDLHLESDSYLTRLTLVWAFYFLIKSVVFLIVALRVNLAMLYFWRVTLGSGSAVALFFGEIFYRKHFRRTRA